METSRENFNQILLDLYCFKNFEGNGDKRVPGFCDSPEYKPSYNCLFNDCTYLGYKTTRNALCYTNNDGEVDMLLSPSGNRDDRGNLDSGLEKVWMNIAVKNIEAAYAELLQTLNRNPHGEEK